jgi:hypothetical protein
MKNPFIYGDFVGADFFCDREEEQKALRRDLGDAQKLFLISPRRYGKTSLLKRVLAQLESEDFIAVYIDLYRASSLHTFLELYCAAVAEAAESALDKALRFVSEVLPRLRPKITVDASGTPSISIEPLLTARDTRQLLDEAFELPATVAKRKKKNVVVVLDEFQEIMNFDGEALEKAMRSHIQGHSAVGYVFSGSKRHILEDMTHDERRAFYRIGKVMYLEKIPRTAFLPFLQQRFEAGGFAVEEGVIAHVLDIADDVPHNAQRLCHELWDDLHESRRVTLSDVDRVFVKILGEQTPYHLQQWDALSLNQRALLKAVTTRGGTNLFSQEFLVHSGIGSLPTLQTSLKLLVKKGVIEKQSEGHAITDVFFREWIRKKI